MNTTDIKKFAKYDIILNKVFYRNMTILAAFIGAGLSLLGFLIRVAMYRGSAGAFYAVNGEVPESMPTHYLNSSMTQVMIFGVIGIMAVIICGYTFHNLRTRQGRINELTLPVGNKERFCWHMMRTFGGGVFLSLLTIISADIVNFIGHTYVFGIHDVYSLTYRMLTFSDINPSDIFLVGILPDYVKGFIISVFYMGTGMGLFQLSAYIFGNSVKYHYNIIITYVVMQIVKFAGFICLTALMYFMFGDSLHGKGEEMTLPVMMYCAYAAGTFLFIMSGVLLWRSYVRYCNAQITTQTNI